MATQAPNSVVLRIGERLKDRLLLVNNDSHSLVAQRAIVAALQDGVTLRPKSLNRKQRSLKLLTLTPALQKIYQHLPEVLAVDFLHEALHAELDRMGVPECRGVKLQDIFVHREANSALVPPQHQNAVVQLMALIKAYKAQKIPATQICQMAGFSREMYYRCGRGDITVTAAKKWLSKLAAINDNFGISAVIVDSNKQTNSEQGARSLRWPISLAIEDALAIQFPLQKKSNRLLMKLREFVAEAPWAKSDGFQFSGMFGQYFVRGEDKAVTEIVVPPENVKVHKIEYRDGHIPQEVFDFCSIMEGMDMVADGPTAITFLFSALKYKENGG